MQKSQTHFGAKDGNKKIITKAEWINSIEKELPIIEEGSKVEIHHNTLEATLKNWKTPGLVGVHGLWFKHSPPSTLDWLPKWVNAYRKQSYPNGWSKERPPSSKETPSEEPPQTIITCLAMIWKVLTTQIREGIYYLLMLQGGKRHRKTNVCR